MKLGIEISNHTARYRSTREPVHELPATKQFARYSLISNDTRFVLGDNGRSRRSARYSPVSNDTGLFQEVTIEISIVIARNRSVTIDFNHYRSLPGSISLAAAWLRRGKKKLRGRSKKKERVFKEEGESRR
ncbi:hypothetical protein GW17_00011735 [Ensete ventricosum]|nr:hypothetical protein GW17_00011735 [Ensete ventricosum]